VAGLGPALVAAGWLAWIVAPAAFSNYKLKQATTRLVQVAAEKPGSNNAQELISEAEDELQKANGANPNSARVWVQMAWLHLEQSVFDPAGFDTFSQQAEEAAGRAVDIAPEAPAPHVALAMAYLINNRLDEAELQVRQALDLAPNDPLVQYYAVAVLALEPSNRMTAKQLVEMVENGTYPAEQVKHMKAAYQWGVTSKVPLEGVRQRPLPPRYVPAAPWPPLDGLSREEAEAEAPAPLPPVKPAPVKPMEALPAMDEPGSGGAGNARAAP
jgi:tetratricopeptide (TPR) repeat protein